MCRLRSEACTASCFSFRQRRQGHHAPEPHGEESPPIAARRRWRRCRAWADFRSARGLTCWFLYHLVAVRTLHVEVLVAANWTAITELQIGHLITLICVGDPRKGGSVGHFLVVGLVPVRARRGGPQAGSRWSARSAARTNDLEADEDPPHTRGLGERGNSCVQVMCASGEENVR